VSSQAPTRFRLTVHYDGSAFHGWQAQKEHRTVQGEIEAVLTRITGARRPVIGSGRTDRGVHATGQVASVDLPSKWEPRSLQRALNALLPREIWIEEVRKAAPDFHPRYDARRRTYLYRVGLGRMSGSPFHRAWCWNLSEANPSPDPSLLTWGASMVVGERSFVNFAKAGQPERGTRCRVFSAEWRPWTDLGYSFQITADRYLHHMVRYLVGTMITVARGHRDAEEFKELLENPETELSTSPPAPPEGLFLHAVEYDPESRVPDTSAPPTPEPDHDR
jgi:tRNA pseudouridine38-40 synthase